MTDEDRAMIDEFERQYERLRRAFEKWYWRTPEEMLNGPSLGQFFADEPVPNKTA